MVAAYSRNCGGSEQPKRIAIVGAGYIAVEQAGALHAVGSQIHYTPTRKRPAEVQPRNWTLLQSLGCRS
ncbi:FAD-dependent oxidoreductase [Paraburkholderia silvatlantica]|uniref:FAD-dependent oxidoreductase n=1 Tax=Paraburkholderia silvatlantica TaxID=321895 RepID=UPI000DA2440D|nr:FAD-dependent oxidoreductase [Paraburkholderia silvatlantica]